MKFWLIDVNRNCLLCERGEERESIVMCLRSLLHHVVGQRNTGLLSQGMVLAMLHRAERCQCDFGLILEAVFTGQG